MHLINKIRGYLGLLPNKSKRVQDLDTERRECSDQGQWGKAGLSSTKPGRVQGLNSQRHECLDQQQWGKGRHEVEYFQHESDLQDKMKKCEKNPGHAGFISVQDFNIEHLPKSYRDNLVWDFIQTIIFLTVRVVVVYTSEDRPDGYCDSDMRGLPWPRVGSGMVRNVYREFTENGKCPCRECKKFPDKAKTRWGAFEVMTAAYVVFNNEECEDTRCDVGFDGDIDKDKCQKLEGWEVEYSDIRCDYCSFYCITHDENVYNKMEKILSRYHDLRGKLDDKYERYEYDDRSKLPVFCVSHPHGMSKHVTVGVKTARQEKWPYAWSYTTQTCPGSGGAPVFTVGRRDWQKLRGYYSVHSRCKKEGENQSGYHGW